MIRRVFTMLAFLFAAVAIYFVYERLTTVKAMGPSSITGAGLLLLVSLVCLVSAIAMNGKFKNVVVGFWVVSVSSVASYLVFDLLAGLFLISPLSPQLVPDAVRHHKLIANATAKFEQKEFSYVQRNNSIGLRGKEIEPRKSPRTFRILTLGDSYTMGKGVEDNETFSYLLEEMINNRLNNCESGYERVEVLNGGVDSYSPILSYLYLSNELYRYEPDLVLLNLDNSDLVQEIAYRNASTRDSNGVIIGVPGTQSKIHPSEKIRDWIENHMYLTRLALYYINNLFEHAELTVRDVVQRANPESVAHTLVGDKVDRTQQWNNIFQSLKLAEQFSQQHSMTFYLTIYPWAHQISGGEWTPALKFYMTPEDRAKENYDAIIVQMAEVYRVSTLNLYPSFRNYGGKHALYFQTDNHFNVHGHQLMAESLLALLSKEPVGEAWCGTQTEGG